MAYHAAMATPGKELLIKDGVVITLDPQLGVIDPGAVLIKDGLVAQVGPSQELVAAHPQAQIIDAQGRAVLPGMINAHDHLYSAFARGISLVGEPPRTFPEILEKLWWRLDKVLTLEDVYSSALVGLIECIKAGTTTVIDHHASPYAARGSLAQVARAFQETGLRGVLCYEVSDRDGSQIAQEGIAENAQFLASCRGNAMLAGLFGLHASFTVSDRTFEAARDASGGAGFHIHLAEDLSDIRLSVDKYRRRPVQRLLDLGILGPQTIAAHGVHLSPAEIDIIGESGASITHQPQSNMNNAVGYAQVRRMLDAGVLVGLGTDGMTQSMFDEARVAPLLMRHEAQDPRVGWEEVPRLLLNNRDIAGKYFSIPLGRLAPGAAGDAIIADYHPTTPLRAENIWGHFFFGIAGRPVLTTIAAGQVLMDDGQITALDEAEVAARARHLAAALWERFKAAPLSKGHGESEIPVDEQR